MGYTRESLQAQLAIAKRELADTQRHIKRSEKRLEDLRGNEDKLCANIMWLEGQINPPQESADKFAQRDESRLEKKRGKFVKEIAPDGTHWTL